jgi:TolB-like protein/Flp pilus assembly protein TadD
VTEPEQMPSNEPRLTGAVFISYAMADRKQALSVCKAIERRGVHCWISCRDVEPGENYQEAIVTAIETSRAMVLVFSEAANRSNEIKKELSLASRFGLTVIALRVEDIEPSRAFAYELSTRQWIDAFEGWDKSLDALVGRIAQISASDEAPIVSAPRVRRMPFPWHLFAGLSRRALVIVASLALIVLAAGTIFLFRSSGAREDISLAVLPFADLSPARDKAYFAEGVAEEILSSLAAEKNIKVLGRTSARQIERDPDPKAIRASLGVTHLLEGSARTAGNDLRVNVRLIDTSDGSQVWEEEYRGGVSDVFKVQDQIATAVVHRLRGTFVNDSVRTATPTAIDAYEAYLAARALMREPKKDSLTQAWRMARQIVDAHPGYAPGHALFASATFLLADSPFTYGDIPFDKARRVAIAHAREAIRLAPDQADGYAALGLALPPPDSLAPLQKAVTLDPSRSSLRDNLGIDLDLLGRHDEAFEQYRLGVEIDPLSSALNNRYVASLAASGKADEAFRAIDAFVRRGGDKAQAWRFRGFANSLLGNEAEAISARRRGLALDPQLPYQAEWLAMSFNLLGLDEQEARYRPGLSPYLQLFLADDRGALREEVLRDGAKAWSANKFEWALFSLARARDWAAIVRVYDARPPDQRDLCGQLPRIAAFTAMALERRGRSAEGAKILGCVQRSLDRQLAMRFRSPDDAPGELELWQASLLAIRNDPRTLNWLDKAVQRGWLGQYYSSNLADWPQFDALRVDPRLAAIQLRIDRRVSAERTKILARK